MHSEVYNRNAGWQHCFVPFFCCCCCLACCCCYPLASRDPTLDTFYSPSWNLCPCAHIPTPFWNLCPFLKRITDKCNDYRVAHTIQPLESETVLLLLHWTLPNDIGGPSFLISICQQTNTKDIAGQSARNHIAIEYSVPLPVVVNLKMPPRPSNCLFVCFSSSFWCQGFWWCQLSRSGCVKGHPGRRNVCFNPPHSGAAPRSRGGLTAATCPSPSTKRQQ